MEQTFCCWTTFSRSRSATGLQRQNPRRVTRDSAFIHSHKPPPSPFTPKLYCVHGLFRLAWSPRGHARLSTANVAVCPIAPCRRPCRRHRANDPPSTLKVSDAVMPSAPRKVTLRPGLMRHRRHASKTKGVEGEGVKGELQSAQGACELPRASYQCELQAPMARGDQGAW